MKQEKAKATETATGNLEKVVYFTLEKVSEMFDVSKGSLYKMLTRNEIPYYIINNRVHITVKEIYAIAMKKVECEISKCSSRIIITVR
jgi:hypothetical protein